MIENPTPHDISLQLSHAARQAANGIQPNLTGIIDPSQRGFSRETNSLLSYVARRMDPSNADAEKPFTDSLKSMLEGIQDQTLGVDLESTLMLEVEDLEAEPENRRRVFCINPPVATMVRSLKNSGNRVFFWTAADTTTTTLMREAMPVDLSGTTTVDREGHKRILDSLQKLSSGDSTELQSLSEIREVFPDMDNAQLLRARTAFEKNLAVRFSKDPDGVARLSKLPQLLMDPQKGFLVDDRSATLDEAAQSGWPKERVVFMYSNPRNEHVLQAASQIQKAFGQE